MTIEFTLTSERLPESDDMLCLIWVDGDYEFAWWYEGTGCWDSPDKGWIKSEKVTCWSPLPDVPLA